MRCGRSTAFASVVDEISRGDLLTAADWPEVACAVGFGRAALGQQDGRAALLSGQLVSADVNDVAMHIKEALERSHPPGGQG